MQNITKALLTLLNKGIVNFTYRKVDGTIRNAVGTRNLCLACQALGLSIPMPKTGRNNPTAYYDIEKNAWRSFVAENVLSINGVAITEIKGIKDDRIVPVGSLEKVDIPINVGGVFLGGKDWDGLSENDKGVVADLEMEIPIHKGGFGGGVPKEEIRKAMDKLDKDIVIGAPAHSPKIGTPICNTDGDVALPIGGLVSIEDFAKLVAKYVVDLLAYRLTK